MNSHHRHCEEATPTRLRRSKTPASRRQAKQSRIFACNHGLLRLWLAMTTVLYLNACSTSGPARDYMPYLAKKGVTQISLDDIPHCQGYGCRIHKTAHLSDADWKDIAPLFHNANTPAKERGAIARAIAIFETKIGTQTGTTADVAGTYVQLGDNQHDCADESINTTIYLDLLKRKQWLSFHDVSTISSRIPVFGGGLGFHQTAVIVERGTDQRFAVDSWFHDNGHNAEIVPLPDWLYGWHPPT